MDDSLRYDTVNRRLICAICIEWIDFIDLYIDESGMTWDICKSCSYNHGIAMMLKIMVNQPVIEADWFGLHPDD